MNTTQLDNLLVLHRLKDARGHGLPSELTAELEARGLLIDTCLRQIWIGTINRTIPASDESTEILQGPAAYNLLLQTMCGLNSSVPGETNVAGQFRCAWKRWRKSAPATQAKGIAAYMHRLHSDSKIVRRTYLENTGGASYGSLVRKLLRPQSDARILFIGSGKFALSILPFFRNQQVALWNHRVHPNLKPADNMQIFSPQAATAAAEWATHIVLTTPADDENDNRWAALIRAHGIAAAVHLSRRRAEPGIWAELPVRYADLDDVFELRKRQSLKRELSVLRARRACERNAYSTDTVAAPQLLTPQEA